MTYLTQQDYETLRDSLLYVPDSVLGSQPAHDLVHNQDGDENKQKLETTKTIMDNAWAAHQAQFDTECDDQDFINITLPLTRMVVPNLVAWELVGVQPMKTAAEHIHTLRVTYRDEVKQLSIQILKEIVTATTKFQLGCRLTSDGRDEMLADPGHRELILNTLAQELIAELDQSLLSDLRSLKQNAELTYDCRPAHRSITPLLPQLKWWQRVLKFIKLYKEPAIDHKNIGDEFAALAILIHRGANMIAARTRRGAGNWVVVSPSALTMLQSATTSCFVRDYQTTEKSLDVSSCKYVGKLNNSINVYIDTYASDDTPALVGYKGSGEIDAGFFFAPYQVVQMSNIDPMTGDNIFTTQNGTLEMPNNRSSLGNSNDYYTRIDINTPHTRCCY